MRRSIRAFALAALFAAVSAVAEARDARCFVTEEGAYPCRVRMTDLNGSFEIDAPERNFYRLVIDQSGSAAGFVNDGAREVSLPGHYFRLPQDRSCWKNGDTGQRICAW